MKMLDVVNQLRLILPKYTDRFSSPLVVTSITASGGTATIVTPSAHGLTTGRQVTLSEVQTQTPISAVSQDGLTFTFTTSSDHDLTLGWPEHETVTLDGFTDSAWNSDFSLVDVPNRRNFSVTSTNTIPTLNGGEDLLEVRTDGVNGAYALTVVDTTSFTVSGSFEDGVYVGGKVSYGVRIAGTVDVTRSLVQYTEQGVNDLWGFVAMHDAEVSKNRAALSDATATPTSGTSLRERIVDGWSLYIFVNTSEDIAAQTAVDICRHELLLPIMRSVYGVRFRSGLSDVTDFKNILTGHGFVSYNRAVYVHTYSFELSMDLTDNDAVLPGDTRAYRDTDLTHEIGTADTQDFEILINQDDHPII